MIDWLAFVSVFSFIIFTIVYIFLCFHVLIFIGFIYAIQFLKILMYSMNLTVRAGLLLFLYACAIENPEISGFCVSKNKGLRRDHKWVISKRSVVLLSRKTSIILSNLLFTDNSTKLIYRCFARTAGPSLISGLMMILLG